MTSSNITTRRGMLAWMTWENSFIFIRSISGMAALICSMFAMSHGFAFETAREKAAKRNFTISECLTVIGTLCLIVLLPFVMLGKHLLLNVYVPTRPRGTVRYWRFGTKVVALLITSFTLLRSVTVTAAEDGKEEGVKLLAFLLGSIVLCEGALLDEDNYGVFELTLTVLVVQVSKAYPKLSRSRLFGIIVLCYFGRGVLMIIMKQMKGQVAWVEKERETKERKRKLEDLTQLWNNTNEKLRNYHQIDVDNQLPEFLEMKSVIRNMQEKEPESND